MRINLAANDLSPADVEMIEANRKDLVGLRFVMGDRLLLLLLADILQEPTEGTTTPNKIGEIIERLSQWEY